MFEDFQKKAGQDSKRFGASLIVASVIFGLFGTGVVVATAGVRSNEPEEELVQVEFAPPPEPEPEPPPPPEPEPEPPPPRPERPEPRPAVQRPELVQPEEISDDELEESDAELAEEGGGGPVDGFLDGTPGGTGTAPAPPPEPEPPPPPPPRPRGPIMRPENAVGGEMIGGMPPIEYPPAARASGVQGMVIIKCVITLAGETDRCSVLRGHPALNEAALANVRARRFTPVRLPDGTPIEVWKVFPVRFQLTNM